MRISINIMALAESFRTWRTLRELLRYWKYWDDKVETTVSSDSQGRTQTFFDRNIPIQINSRFEQRIDNYSKMNLHKTFPSQELE